MLCHLVASRLEAWNISTAQCQGQETAVPMFVVDLGCEPAKLCSLASTVKMLRVGKQDFSVQIQALQLSRYNPVC